MNDVDSVVKHANDKDIAKNLSTLPHPYTKKDAKKWISRQVDLQKQKNPADVVFAIEIGGEAVGSIGLHRIALDHKAELGYWLGRKYWGGGLMTEAVKQVTNFGFRKLKLRRIWAGVFPFNKGSMRVLEKNGFKFEGVSRKEVKKGSKFLDVHVFAKVR